jgi:hypothetical protein
MIRLPALLLIVTIVSSMQEMMQDYRLQLRANSLYEKREYGKAERTFRQLLSTLPEGRKKTSTTYNLACAQYMQGKFMDASVMFAHKQATAGKSRDIELQSLFNEGNSLAMSAIGTPVKSRKTALFRNSLDRLKSVLLSNPNDGDAKINYEIVRRYLHELEPPQHSSSSSADNNGKTEPKSGISQDMAQRMLEHTQQDESSLMRQLPRNKSTAAKSRSNNLDW